MTEGNNEGPSQRQKCTNNMKLSQGPTKQKKPPREMVTLVTEKLRSQTAKDEVALKQRQEATSRLDQRGPARQAGAMEEIKPLRGSAPDEEGENYPQLPFCHPPVSCQCLRGPSQELGEGLWAELCDLEQSKGGVGRERGVALGAGWLRTGISLKKRTQWSTDRHCRCQERERFLGRT